MPERENDLSNFADEIPNDFVEETRSWFDDIPNMPEPGYGRFAASNTYERILEAYAKAQEEQRQLTPEDVTRIFDSDKEGINKRRNDLSFDPSLDYSLRNLLAIGTWYEREEFEKEEGITLRYQTLKEVNRLIRQCLDPSASGQAAPPQR